MAAYVFRRLIQAVVTLWLISLLTFVVAKLTPGGPFGLEDSDQAVRVPQEMRDHYRRLYGLDQPPTVQYARWLVSVLRGDLGMSYATLAVIVFAVELRVFPLIGWGQPARIAVPAGVLALGPLSAVIRMTRTAALEVLHSDYLRTARAKGLGERAILLRHLLKNALLPVLTLAGPLAAGLLGGPFFVETIFNIPGLGATFVYAAAERDYPLIMAAALTSGSLIVLLNLGVDLAYGLLDPRIRVTGEG